MVFYWREENPFPKLFFVAQGQEWKILCKVLDSQNTTTFKGSKVIKAYDAVEGTVGQWYPRRAYVWRHRKIEGKRRKKERKHRSKLK